MENWTRPLGLDEGVAGDGVDLCWMDGDNTLERILVNRTMLEMIFLSIKSEIKFVFLAKPEIIHKSLGAIQNGGII